MLSDWFREYHMTVNKAMCSPLALYDIPRDHR